MKTMMLKTDMHVHSKYSKRPSEWVLRKLGAAESYTEPTELYRIARDRGMNLVTITDHNSIGGALEIAHLPGTFISEEVTSYFPEDGCKAHVLVYDITEGQHQEISLIRKNIYDLVKYLREQELLHAIAHPLFPINDRLTPQHVEKFLVLFNILEANGARDVLQNQFIKNLVNGLTKEKLEELADKHNLEPCGKAPWKKQLISGSDDHSSLTIAAAYTQVECDLDDKNSFLREIAAGRAVPGGNTSEPKTLAHNIYSIAFQYYKQKFSLDRFVEGEVLTKFIDQVMSPCPAGVEPDAGFVDRLKGLFHNSRKGRFFKAEPQNLQEMLQMEARKVILNNSAMYRLVKDPSPPPIQKPEVWFRFVNKMSETVLKASADKALDKLSTGNFFDLFHMLGSAGSLYTMLSPYLVAWAVFANGRNMVRNCKLHFAPDNKSVSKPEVRMGHFTDTLHEINGVALTLNMQIDIARKNEIPLTMITCGPENGKPGVKHFKAVGEFGLPEYQEIKLYYPPLMEMIDYCYENNFTHIHSATPGPIGLAALAIARVLKLPIYGTYHTALPQYASLITGDPNMEELGWKYIVWYYDQMDKIYVPSRATGAELAEKGISKNKIKFYERGIDIDRFHPRNRNGFYNSHFNLDDSITKLLYVGRVSKEKNLPFLAETFKEMRRVNDKLHLIVVGDGPYLKEMKQVLQGENATFTGYLQGNDLEQAYASADVFVFPSTTDTFGNAILEAQASGVPVVVSDEGGPRENCVSGKTGFIVPSHDAAAFKEVVLKLASDPELRKQMGLDARDYMQRHSFESKYMELWESYGRAA
ncbi:glycosyltransferase [Desulfatibacillum aliphaticivorans]|uniref:glycosyltransferase n=1 Tax=Desulfatibacillum aliphaticivorans TaxID=218208 RepID=UPI0003F8F373|nr:glycosyltransferase [Desulfatibacillum aliphaticivorans]